MTSIIKNPRRIFTSDNFDPGLDSRITILENNEYKILYFQTISTATGTITIPTEATILLDQFYEGGDAIVETLVNGQPSGQSPLTAGGAVVSVSSFDASGNFTLSGTPSSFDVALVYILKIKAVDYQNLTIDNIMAMEDISPSTLLFQGSFAATSLVDSITYHFSNMNGLSATPTASFSKFGFDKNKKITNVVLTCSQNVNFSDESVSLYLRKNNTTDYTITTSLDLSTVGLNTSKNFYYTVDIDVTTGDDYEFKFVTPAFTTNGTNSRWHISLYGY